MAATMMSDEEQGMDTGAEESGEMMSAHGQMPAPKTTMSCIDHGGVCEQMKNGY